MKAVFPFILSILFCPALGNIGPQGFGQFLNHYFVETGTFGGEGLEKARKVGFPELRSMEYDQRLYSEAKKRFAKHNNVRLWNGDSSTMLWSMIQDITQPITFWLDAHVCPPRTDGGKNCPLIEELEQIKHHPIKTHTILIDDMHCAGTELFDYLTKEDLIAKILEINPDYTIMYVTGGEEGEYPDNVMVAIIK